MNSLAAGSALLLAALMAWSGLAKVKENDFWRKQLTGYYLPRPARIFGFLVLPWIELLCALLFAYQAAWAAAAVAALMLAFSILIVRARMMQPGDKIGCGCFGGRSLHDYRLLLARNLGITSLAAVVWRQAEALPHVSGRSAALVALAASAAAAAWICAQVIQNFRPNHASTKSDGLPSESPRVGFK